MNLEVAIVGGGPAGAAAAFVLAKRGIDVGVVEPGDRVKAGECLHPNGAILLSRIGLADPSSEGHRSSPGLRAVWGEYVVDRDFINHPQGQGWNLDRPRFEAGLRMRAIDAGAKWIVGRFVEARPSKLGFRLICSKTDGARVAVEAATVIDASGRAAVFARRHGATLIETSRLVAIHTRYCGQVSDPRLLVESGDCGWWYSAGLTDGLVASFQTTLLELHEAPLGPETGARLAGLTVQTSRRFAAGSSRLDHMAGNGWLAIGDAAAAYDPLSGHGIAAALASGIDGAGVMECWLAGDREALARHTQVRTKAWTAFREGLAAQYTQLERTGVCKAR